MRLYRWVMNQVQKSGYEEHHFWVYIRCSRCDEILKIHLDLRNDLSIQYSDDGKSDYYFTRKTIIGNNLCFEPIEIELKFDAQRRLINQNITGGAVLSEQGFDSYTRTKTFTN